MRRARKFRLALLLTLLAAGAAGQETLPSPTTPQMLHDLPLDDARRAQLQAAMGRRDYTAAEDLLAEEARRQPKSQAVLLVLANILFLDGKHLNCAVALKKAEKLAPLDERNRFLLALSYVTIGRVNWARPEFETLARSVPSSAVYPYWLARIAYRKMDIDEAIAHARKAIELDPKFMKAYDQLGLCYAAQGNREQAIRAFQEAIRLNSGMPAPSPWPPMNLGVLLLRLERLEEAEGSMRESIRIDRNFPVAHHRLGQVLEKRAQREGAIAEFRQAAALDPTYPDPHYALARVFRQQGDLKAAEKELSLFRDLRKADIAKGITRPD